MQWTLKGDTAQIGESIWAGITENALDPVGRGQAIVILLMLPELERSGDLAAHIAQRALTDLGGEMTPSAGGWCHPVNLAGQIENLRGARETADAAR